MFYLTLSFQMLMNIKFLLACFFCFFTTTTFAKVVYYATLNTTIVQAPDRLLNKKKLKQQKLRKQKKPLQIKSKRAGQLFLVIGCIFVGIALILAALILFIFPGSLVFLVIPGAFLLPAISLIIYGLHYMNRNNNWDIDYR